MRPIEQRKRASLAAYKRTCAEEYSALATHYCLLRGVFWGADFTQTQNGLRDKPVLSNGGRHLASAAREVVICGRSTAVVSGWVLAGTNPVPRWLNGRAFGC